MACRLMCQSFWTCGIVALESLLLGHMRPYDVISMSHMPQLLKPFINISPVLTLCLPLGLVALLPCQGCLRLAFTAQAQLPDTLLPCLVSLCARLPCTSILPSPSRMQRSVDPTPCRVARRFWARLPCGIRARPWPFRLLLLQQAVPAAGGGSAIGRRQRPQQPLAQYDEHAGVSSHVTAPWVGRSDRNNRSLDTTSMPAFLPT